MNNFFQYTARNETIQKTLKNFVKLSAKVSYWNFKNYLGSGQP